MLHSPCISDRFVLPSDRFWQQRPNENVLKSDLLQSIKKSTGAAYSADHIVTLLFGHGDSEEEHLGRVRCGAIGKRLVWVTRQEVEGALGDTKVSLRALASISNLRYLMNGPTDDSSTIPLAMFANILMDSLALKIVCYSKHAADIALSGSSRANFKETDVMEEQCGFYY
ncbi:hypothetical protein BDP27DRAFT_1438598 [Rhodocollybia butyracea]|uniref:Uncharacterized protein n=1 Tax=Rhodocollybia butyracea TaxID=206335 RepID=A0A9P5P4H6_9AGAR|nr:hypothetical protein BDP27DRAFT_1438598 [Rhodocollybia butyracea]